MSFKFFALSGKLKKEALLKCGMVDICAILLIQASEICIILEISNAKKEEHNTVDLLRYKDLIGLKPLANKDSSLFFVAKSESIDTKGLKPFFLSISQQL